MDFRLQKFRLALGVLIAGTLLGIAAAAWQGWGLGRGYPDNTYLGLPRVVCSDFTNVLHFCSLPSPYDDRYAVYLPSAYLLFRPLASLGNPAVALLIFFFPTYYMGAALQAVLLRPIIARRGLCFLTAVLLILLSYPALICLNRGNTEVLMAVLIGGAFVLMERRHFGWAAFLISITVAMKLYPVILMLLFLRRGHLKEMACALALVVIFTAASLGAFAHTPLENEALWQQNFAFYDRQYLINNFGLAGSASGWNLIKILFLTLARLGGSAGLPHLEAWLPLLLTIYKMIYLALVAGLAFFVIFVEREFFRRALLLLFVAATSAPSGGDYKLIFIHIALLLLILLSTRRLHDRLVTVLLALVLVPKKQIFLTYLGVSDTGYPDVSIGVLINPLLLVAAAALLMWDGWTLRIRGWGARRFMVLVSVLGKGRLPLMQKLNAVG